MVRFLPVSALERLEGLSPCRFEPSELGKTLVCDGLKPERFLVLVTDGDIVALPAVYQGIDPSELDFELAVRHGIWRLAIYLFGDVYVAGVVLKNSHFESPKKVYDFSVNFDLSKVLGLSPDTRILALLPHGYTGTHSGIFPSASGGSFR